MVEGTIELRFSHSYFEQKNCDLIVTKSKVQYRGLLSKVVSRPNVTKLKFVTKSKFCCTCTCIKCYNRIHEHYYVITAQCE